MTPDASDVDNAVMALEAGGIAIIATDTVYGLVAAAASHAAIRRLYALKNRPEHIPLSLLAADLDTVYAALPALGRRQRAAMEAVLPGPYTLVVPDRGARFRHLRSRQGAALGLRVPVLRAGAGAVVARAGPLASTSANLHGGADAASIGDLTPALVSSTDALVDDGVLPGVASTVVDITGDRPVVLRAGAVPAALALTRLEPAFE